MSQQVDQFGKRVAASFSEESQCLDRGAGDAKRPFVGRGHELEILRDAAALATNGRGGLVLLVGEPGIGKTRLAEELAADASARGACVLWGRCWEGSGAQAFWPWIQVIRSYLHERDLSDLLIKLRGQAADISRIVPELQRGSSARQTHVSAEPEGAEERFRVFESVAAVLRCVAVRQPLLVVLDDLHWADRPSLVLLEFLVGELARSRILIVGTYRDVEVGPSHPLRQTLAELARHGSVRRLTLECLDRASVVSFVSAVCRYATDSGWVDILYERSEGNPFFLIELVRLLTTESGEEEAVRRVLASEVPQTVRDVIARRLHYLSAETKLMLAIASAVGRVFDINVVQHVSGIRIDNFLDCIDEAVAARVLVEVPDFIGRYRFLHVLLQETLSGETTIRRRVELHRSIASALEQLNADDLDSCAAQLAHHYLRCSAYEGIDKALTYTIVAGRYASQTLAYEDSVVHYRQALDLLDMRSSSELQRCEILVALGDAQNQTGAWKEARQIFETAARLARRVDAPDLLAKAAIGYKGFSWSTSPIDTESVALLEEALAALPMDAGILHVLVLRALSMLSYFEPGPRGQLASDRAVQMAEEIDDDVARGYALEARLVSGWKPSNLAETLDAATQMVRFATRSGQPELGFQGHLVRYASLLEFGDCRGAECEAERCASTAQDLRHPKCVWQMAVLSCGRALLHADLPQAEWLLNQVSELGRRLPGEMASHYVNLHTFLLSRTRGCLGELLDAIAPLARQHSDLTNYKVALAAAYAAGGNDREAQSVAISLLEERSLDLGDNSFLLLNIAVLSEVCASLNDRARAQILYSLGLPYADHNVVVSWGAACDGSMSHHLGVLATVLGRWKDAEEHFDRALRMNTDLQAPLLLARTRLAQAEMLIRRSDHGDDERAGDLVREAVATYKRLGVKAQLQSALRLEDRVRAERKARPASSHSFVLDSSPDLAVAEYEARRQGAAATNLPTNLFCREGEYWTLVFDGKLNRLRSTRGLEYLAYLVARPNQPVHALDLTAAVGSAARPAQGSAELGRQLVADGGARRSRLGDLGRVVDARALKEYRERLRELREELREAEEFNDLARISRLRDEIQLLTTHLAAASRRDGGARVAGSYSERARISVKNNITSAMKIIGQHDDALARHLSNAVRTGTFCSYAPERPVLWKFGSSEIANWPQ